MTSSVISSSGNEPARNLIVDDYPMMCKQTVREILIKCLRAYSVMAETAMQFGT